LWVCERSESTTVRPRRDSKKLHDPKRADREVWRLALEKEPCRVVENDAGLLHHRQLGVKST
jgi:hypothetical protein